MGLSQANVALRRASGALTAGETTAPLVGIGWANLAVVRIDITTLTTPDGDDEVDFFIQTSYNGGTDWVDVEQIHYANAENGTTPTVLAVIGGPQSSAVARAETAAALADDTKLDLPLGDRLRIVTAVAGATAPTYAYNAEVFLRE